MDEFTSIAVWILATFLVLNAGIFWFANTDTMINNGLGVQGISENDAFSDSDQNALKLNFFGVEVDCSTASPTDLSFGPCFLARAMTLFDDVMTNLWNFLTGWVYLLNVILPEWLPASGLLKAILIPVLGLIQFFSIFVIVLRVAGIIRGGS